MTYARSRERDIRLRSEYNVAGNACSTHSATLRYADVCAIVFAIAQTYTQANIIYASKTIASRCINRECVRVFLSVCQRDCVFIRMLAPPRVRV